MDAHALRRRTLVVVVAVSLQAASFAHADGAGDPTWLAAGHDLHNTRNQPHESLINVDNAANLAVRWVFQTGNDIFATPAVDDTAVYVSDAVGDLYAIERESGVRRWQTTIASYTGITDDYSRTTPAVDGARLFIGDQGGRKSQGARVLAIDKQTGTLLWSTQVEAHPAAIITQSPVVYNGTVYVGVSSNEEGLAAYVENYACCSFRGSVVALNANTGAIVWKRFMTATDDALGFSGAAVWGNTPVVDIKRHSLYVTTGNNYRVPQSILDCESLSTAHEVSECIAAVPGSSDNHIDAMVALDLKSGRIRWAHSLTTFDSWTVACIVSDVPSDAGNCSEPSGEDSDFGQGPILYTTNRAGRRRDLLGAGQKSGAFWALDPDTGNVVWKTQVGPGNAKGGIMFGSASDGQRIYTAVANGAAQTVTLTSGVTTTYGFWSALDPATGRILWQTNGTPAVTALIQGPLTVANGVLYGGVLDAAGTMYALDASNGATLWTFASGGSVNAGAAVVDGSVYWGSGYVYDNQTESNRLYAFSLPDR